MGKVATALRQQDERARLVPDAGKEDDAHRIAAEIGAAVAAMPDGEANNFDANDLMQRDGFDVLAALQWRIRGVLPADGLAGLYGPRASGKSF